VFGDSLSQGLYRSEDFSPLFHPYSLELQKRLPGANVMESGLSGEEVGHMLVRLKAKLLDIPVAQKPAVVVILGGTNDIGIGRIRGPRIAERLIEMHEHLRVLHDTDPAFAGLLHSVAVTVPVLLSRTDHNRQERMFVNDALREYVSRSARHHDGFTWLLDISNLFLTQSCVPFGQTDEGCRAGAEPPFDPLNARFWDPRSPLHFSPQGYDELGRIVFERLCLDREIATQ